MVLLRAAVSDVQSISERIVALRQAYGWSATEACRACGIEKTAWSNYERRRSRPLLDNGAAICEVFGVTLDWLYTGNTTGLSQQALTMLYRETA